MRRDPTLSEEVQGYIQTLDWENEHGLTAEEKKKLEEGHKLVRGIVHYVLTSREQLAEYQFEELELFVQGAPDLVAEFLNQHYTREAVGSVHGYVDRTMELSHMSAERTPSKVTNTYLQEATRTYIIGFPLACVALCRSALEQSLKESLGYQLSGTFTKFQDLVNEAVRWNVLGKQNARIARRLAKEGDDVLHEKPIDLTKAREVLVQVRSLIQQIYSSEAGH
jgi:hypothetical protein